jgi:hypothetical protein
MRKHLILAAALLPLAAFAAERSLDVEPNPGGQVSGQLATWTGLLNGDTGERYEGIDFADRTLQVTGTFGAGGSVSLEGSNTGAVGTWITLTDFAGDPITCTDACLKVVLENPRYLRPSVTAGDGSTSLTVTILGKRIR